MPQHKPRPERCCWILARHPNESPIPHHPANTSRNPTLRTHRIQLLPDLRRLPSQPRTQTHPFPDSIRLTPARLHVRCRRRLKTRRHIDTQPTRHSHQSCRQLMSDRPRLGCDKVKSKITPDPKSTIAVLHNAPELDGLIHRKTLPLLRIDGLPTGGRVVPKDNLSFRHPEQPFSRTGQMSVSRGFFPNQPRRTWQSGPRSAIWVQPEQHAGIRHSKPPPTGPRKRRQVSSRQSVNGRKRIHHQCLRVQDSRTTIYRHPYPLGTHLHVPDGMMLNLSPHRIQPPVDRREGPKRVPCGVGGAATKCDHHPDLTPRNRKMLHPLHGYRRRKTKWSQRKCDRRRQPIDRSRWKHIRNVVRTHGSAKSRHPDPKPNETTSRLQQPIHAEVSVRLQPTGVNAPPGLGPIHRRYDRDLKKSISQ